MKIVTIHGAFSSPHVFNYIKHTTQNATFVDFSYQDRYKDVSNVIEDCNEFINNEDSEVILMGHSLGGIIGSNLLSNKNVKGLVTIASPIAGIKINFYASTFFFKQTFVQEITPFSPTIVSCKENLDLTSKPVNHIITTKGYSPFMHTDNDGVITVESQIYGNNNSTYIQANHHDVLQHPNTIHELDKIFQKIKK
jgi:esterase/lipase